MDWKRSNPKEQHRKEINRSFVLKRKPKIYREVLFTQVPDNVDQTKLLQDVLPKKWKVSPPDAIIAITGICHQFNIKDKRNLKRDLIEAVISTGSWIVTCGTESGVVQFIKDAVNDHVTLTTYNIPIVGIMTKRVLDEIKDTTKSVKILTEYERDHITTTTIPVKSTKETLDPNHTQFIFLENSSRKRIRRNAASECRNAFERFLWNIKDADINDGTKTTNNYTKRKAFQSYTNVILPVVLVVIEGGIGAMKTALSVLENNNPVVLIKGSGGAADFLSTCYQQNSRNGNFESEKLSGSVENIQELIKKCFEDDPKTSEAEAIEMATLCLKKPKLINIYSLEDKTAKVDEFIQNAMFDTYKDYYERNISNPPKLTNKRDLKTKAVKTQLKLVEKWKRCDIAENDIFVSGNRKQLTDLQTLDTQRMRNLVGSIRTLILEVNKKYECIPKKKISFEFEANFLKFNEENKAKYFTDVSDSFTTLIYRLDDQDFCELYWKLKTIIAEIVDEYKKDDVSQLFQSSLVDNRTDFVMLVMERIENMKMFVLGYIPDLYRRCIYESKDDLAIKLIDQHWKKPSKEVEKSTKLKEVQNERDELSQTIRSIKEKKNNIKSNKILFGVDNFIRELFGDTEFKLYEFKGENNEEISVVHNDKPFHHLFVWAILMNWREMALIFWKQETDLICSALFASAVLNALAEKAALSNHMAQTVSLGENARYFESEACNVMTELYRNDREKALTILVTKVGRFNSTPLQIAYSQNLKTFMAHTACQAKLSSIWSGDIALYTPTWRIGMAVLFPMLIIQNLGFITIQKKNVISKQNKPSQHQVNCAQDQNPECNNTKDYAFPGMLYCAYLFYISPVAKFFFYMITYLAFLVIFALFVLTDLYPLSERSPSTLEYLTWLWTLSLAMEEMRQILQTNRGSLTQNLQYWAKDVWNIFDIAMYFLFLVSVILRCLLSSNQFYFARMTYAITLSMFILRSMHFFFIQRYIGPKVVMIGRMMQDLAFFISLFVLFVFSFGIMYQAVLFPNSVLSRWELFKDLVYLPYWQLYGELNLDRIEGKEPSECTKDIHLYTNGTMSRCAETNQFNSLMLAVYLILANILLVNMLIAMFSDTFQKVQDNSEIIWKFHMYALVYEYYDRPMFPIPIVIHLCRIVVFCYDKIQEYRDRLRNCKERKTMYASAFILNLGIDEIERLHIVEKIALENYQNGTTRARSRYNARNMMTDERDINKESDSTTTQHEIKALQEDIQRVIQEIRQLNVQKSIVVFDYQR
ncbi:TRPM1 [Mytilus coruscus]|uniref:TRPM1 n=1 Tax=Mytilus coruscus TaxID=42192 RepID=A0A6J8BBD8_MYTCO|nr:TRPM1 [Mytilus coruscus]